MYQFKEYVHTRQHFWFEKAWIINMNWAVLPKASKAVYPVIACHKNEKGVSYPGENAIAALSGRSQKTVRQGVRGLDGFPGFRWEWYTTKRGRRSKKFYLEPQVIHGRGAAFPFYKDILMSGVWSQLKPASQALYPVLRHYGYTDYEECFDDEESFFDRRCENCVAEKSLLAKFAGIDRTSANSAIRDLIRNGLIDASATDIVYALTVYLRPQVYYKRAFLNMESKRRLERDPEMTTPRSLK